MLNTRAFSFVLIGKWFSALAVCAVLGLFILQAWHSGSAYAVEHRVHMKLASWYVASAEPGRAQWRVQQMHMKQAIALMPGNALFNITLGRLYEFRAFHIERKGSVERNLDALKAMNRYRQASRESPTWVYPWLDMAEIKSRIGQLDDEFMVAYLHAIKLGPWEKNVMPTLVDLGLYAYTSMSEAQQGQVDAYIDRVVAGESRQIAQTLKSWENFGYDCQRLQQFKRRFAFGKLCAGKAAGN